jgi:2-keto-4-pentenoate hydratase
MTAEADRYEECAARLRRATVTQVLAAGLDGPAPINASSGLAVLGANRTPLADLDLRPLAMSLALNGTSASAGTGADCLGDPLDALAWLANAVRELGDPLLAGEVVLTGALGPMVTVGAGDVVDLEITGLGTARTIFGRREETR